MDNYQEEDFLKLEKFNTYNKTKVIKYSTILLLGSFSLFFLYKNTIKNNKKK